MANTDFKDFFLGLDEVRRASFARTARTTQGYILTHLIYARRAPRPPLLNRLIAASLKFGGPSESELFTFFYSRPEKKRGVA